MPREETSESYSDDDEDQAAADAFDSVLESAVSALQDRWNGAIDHGKGLVSQNLSFLSAGQMLPPNVDTPISPSLPMSSFNPGQPLALALNPMQLQQLPLALASPAYIAHGITQGVMGPHDEASRAAQAVAAVTSTRTPKASTAAAAAAAQVASQLMHAEAETGSDGRDSTGRPTNPVLQQMLVGCPPPPRAERKTWSAEEDAAIHSLIAQHGPRWCAIAPHLAGRSDDSVRNRWKRISEERGLKVPVSAPVVLHSATPTAGSSFTVARTLAATAPVGIKGHGMGTRKRLTEMNATQLNSCLSLPQRGPLGQPVLAHTVAAARPRTSRTMVAESVARTPSVGTMGDEMMARLPVARTVAAASIASAVAAASFRASIPSLMSAEEARLRAELMWYRSLTWKAVECRSRPARERCAYQPAAFHTCLYEAHRAARSHRGPTYGAPTKEPDL